MMFRGITAYYCENNRGHKNAQWQNTKFVLQQVLRSYHYALDGYNLNRPQFRGEREHTCNIPT